MFTSVLWLRSLNLIEMEQRANERQFQYERDERMAEYEERRKNAKYGPFPENYETLVNAWLKKNAKDPDSIKDLSIATPFKFLFGTFEGYAVPVTFNAKNSFGAYTGRKTYTVYIKDGEIVNVSSFE